MKTPRKDLPQAEAGAQPTKAAARAARPGSGRPRSSRKETTERILDAAEYLFSRRDPSSVTVREIAERAGVTHALIHQYVGTKDQLLSTVIGRAAPDRTRMVREMPDFHTVMPLLFNDVLDRRIHTRSVIRSAMDDVEYASLNERLTTGRAMLDLAVAAKASGARRLKAPDAMDPRITMAAAVAFAYGWVAVDSWLVPIFDLAEEDPEEIRSQLAEVFMYLADLALPAEGQPLADKE